MLKIHLSLNYLAKFKNTQVNYTLEDCLEAEAKYFKDFNSSRTNMSSVALLRADLAQGKKYAERIEENFRKLGVHVELIGAEDDGENSVVGYRGLKDAMVSTT